MGLPFQVFILGLLTVFLVLLVVVGTGNAIIWFVNRYISTATREAATRTKPSPRSPAPETIAAITAAVRTVSGGKGRVTTIEKRG